MKQPRLNVLGAVVRFEQCERWNYALLCFILFCKGTSSGVSVSWAHTAFGLSLGN